MRIAVALLFLEIINLGILGCGSRQFTQGSYDDLSEDRLLDDKFNESDMRQIADTMVKSLTESAVIRDAKKPPVVLVTLVKNRSQEHIDMKSMTDKMKVALIKSGKFKFTEKENREEMASETDYQGQSGYVDPATARKKGKQIGAQFFLTGEITDRVQEVGSKKYVYYKCTFNLVNIESGILEWADDKDIRKFYTKKSVGF
ncbi:MAG: penicillin-binding protein activator LpoB [Deltaproteobacteria bacterium]|nr:penicillin-binding protein activator LpoB [Deltaproteobacteria bacterium]